VRAADSADHHDWHLPVAKLGQPLSVSLSSCCAPPPFPFPTGRPATASLRSPLALAECECLSKNEQRRRVFRLAARLLRGVPERVVDSSTRIAVKQTSAPALHPSRTHRILLSQ
jgi:hypothetical protein